MQEEIDRLIEAMEGLPFNGAAHHVARGIVELAYGSDTYLVGVITQLCVKEGRPPRPVPLPAGMDWIEGY